MPQYYRGYAVRPGGEEIELKQNGWVSRIDDAIAQYKNANYGSYVPRPAILDVIPTEIITPETAQRWRDIDYNAQSGRQTDEYIALRDQAARQDSIFNSNPVFRDIPSEGILESQRLYERFRKSNQTPSPKPVVPTASQPSSSGRSIIKPLAALAAAASTAGRRANAVVNRAASSGGSFGRTR